MLIALQRELAAHAADGAGAAVLCGEDGVFSAGIDLAEIGDVDAVLEVDALIAATSDTIRSLPIPVVAAIEGPCFGAAVDIALACDARIAGADARFGVPAVRLGILYRPDGIADMIATVGRETVSRLLLFGERISAHDAVGARLVGRVVPAGQALDAAITLARGAVGSPSGALRASKRLIGEIVGVHPDLTGWEHERIALVRSTLQSTSVEAAKATLGVSEGSRRADPGSR